MPITREELLRAVQEAGLVTRQLEGWSRCMAPAHLHHAHRRLYIAHGCTADEHPKVDLSRFSLQHPAVLQRNPEAAEDHKGRVMGMLDFGLPDHEVWDAFRLALRAIREQPTLFPGLIPDAPSKRRRRTRRA
jgi:hypothetical protein